MMEGLEGDIMVAGCMRPESWTSPALRRYLLFAISRFKPTRNQVKSVIVGLILVEDKERHSEGYQFIVYSTMSSLIFTACSLPFPKLARQDREIQNTLNDASRNLFAFSITCASI